MTENALAFGPAASIVGIVTDPAPGVPARSVGVVFLNAGVLHRVGPARVHVTIARELQALGFTSLRFDFSGIGDSPRRPSSMSFPELAVSESIEAMDLLARTRGLKTFVLVGVCSGADVALQVGRVDPRVVGAALIDGYNMSTLGFLIAIAKRQLFSLRSWGRFLSGRSETLKVLRVSTLVHESAETYIFPNYGDFARGLRFLSDRGAAILLGFTGGTPAYHHYRHGLRRRLLRWPSRANVQVEYLGEMDHTFTLVRNQKRLVSLIAQWVLTKAENRPSITRPEPVAVRGCEASTPTA